MSMVVRLYRRGYGRTLVAVLIIGAYVFPVYWMVATSLKTSKDIFAVPPHLVPAPPTFLAYSNAVIHNAAIHRALVNSAIISVGTMALTLILALPAAYALARLRLRLAGLVLLLLLVSQMLPPINLAVPLFVLFKYIGLVNTYPGLILADTVFVLPFAIIILRPFFLNIPGDLEDAARVDGCSRLGAFSRVVVPLVVPGLIAVGALAFVLVWGEFVLALTLMTSNNMYPITVALNRFIGQYGTQWNLLMAVSTTVALPILLTFVVLQRYIVSGLAAGATKE
jgi:multiple sugar transport system permease protein